MHISVHENCYKVHEICFGAHKTKFETYPRNYLIADGEQKKGYRCYFSGKFCSRRYEKIVHWGARTSLS